MKLFKLVKSYASDQVEMSGADLCFVARLPQNINMILTDDNRWLIRHNGNVWKAYKTVDHAKSPLQLDVPTRYLHRKSELEYLSSRQALLKELLPIKKKYLSITIDKLVDSIKEEIHEAIVKYTDMLATIVLYKNIYNEYVVCYISGIMFFEEGELVCEVMDPFGERHNVYMSKLRIIEI